MPRIRINHDFGQYNNIITAYLEALLDNSAIELDKDVQNRKINGTLQEKIAIAKGIKYIEDYLYHYYENYPDKFNEILNVTINNVKKIACLPNEKRGLYGEAKVNEKIIYINPNLTPSSTLTSDERMRLYIAHEIGHMVNARWLKTVYEYLDRECRRGSITQQEAELIQEGLSLLDEATTQERAEEITYKKANKSRPLQRYHIQQRLFNGAPYKTNFDYYGELQEPTIMFSRTLRGIGKENNDLKVMKLISERALSKSFFEDILDEYTRDGQLSALLEETKYMGLLKKASYALFGMDDPKYCRNSQQYLDELTSITSKMRDHREPYTK